MNRVPALAALVAAFFMSGCATPPEPFVCSTPTDVRACELEKRIHEIERIIQADREADEYRRICRQTHGQASALCQ